MFAKVGFFHFGRNHSKPLEELRSALVAADNTETPSRKRLLNGSLIVLPEAFNIGKYYKDKERPCDLDPTVPFCLRRIAKEFGVAFVVGLIFEQGDGIMPPYSSAYFINGSSHVLMCHKISEDNFEGINYTACEVAACDVKNPYVYGDEGIVIGALICVDASPLHRLPFLSPEHVRRERVVTGMDTFVGACKIVCVPACVNNNFQGGEVGQSIVFPCKNKIVVLANSDPHGVKSFITNERGEILDSSVGGEENRVVVRPLRKNEQGTYTC